MTSYKFKAKTELVTEMVNPIISSLEEIDTSFKIINQVNLVLEELLVNIAHYATRSAVALTPYTSAVGNAMLTYQFTLPDDVKSVKVHVIVKSTLDFLDTGGFEYTVSLDGGEAQVVNFNKTLVDRQPYMYSEYYPAVASRVVEKVVELPVQKEDVHRLTLQPKHPGIVFEKIVVDAGGYQPQFLFGKESPCKRQ